MPPAPLMPPDCAASAIFAASAIVAPDFAASAIFAASFAARAAGAIDNLASGAALPAGGRTAFAGRLADRRAEQSQGAARDT